MREEEKADTIGCAPVDYARNFRAMKFALLVAERMVLRYAEMEGL